MQLFKLKRSEVSKNIFVSTSYDKWMRVIYVSQKHEHLTIKKES